jgi:hypothetical protein
MKALKESFTIAMSPDERDALLRHLWRTHGHLEGYFDQVGDVESGTEDAKLMDSMGRIYDFARALENATYA